MRTPLLKTGRVENKGYLKGLHLIPLKKVNCCQLITEQLWTRIKYIFPAHLAKWLDISMLVKFWCISVYSYTSQFSIQLLVCFSLIVSRHSEKGHSERSWRTSRWERSSPALHLCHFITLQLARYPCKVVHSLQTAKKAALRRTCMHFLSSTVLTHFLTSSNSISLPSSSSLGKVCKGKHCLSLTVLLQSKQTNAQSSEQLYN